MYLSAFMQKVQQARAELQDAIRAGQQPSSFSQLQPMLDAPQQPAQPAVDPAMLQQLMAAQMADPAAMGAPVPQQPTMPVQPPMAFAKGGLAARGAWTRKEGQNSEGGLNAVGRASLKAQGHDIKPPVSAKQAKKSPKAAARRKSFCARMGGMEGPMKDGKGRPTRKALALRKWDC